MPLEILKAYFPFLRDDVRLGAWVYPNGRQVLRMEQFDSATNKIIQFDELDCIHTAIQDIPIEEFQTEDITQEFVDNTLRLRTTDRPRVIHLAPEEKFKAFQSWVAGIAEAGMDAFQLQTEIEAANQLAYPITDHLLFFMTKVDPKFISMYLRKTEQECMFEGIRHESFLISKLLPICSFLFSDLVSHQGLSREGQEILAMIISLNPPPALFGKNPTFCFYLSYQWPFYESVLQSYPEIPETLFLMLVSFGAQREYPSFSVFAYQDELNPLTIFLNQLWRNCTLSSPVQKKLLIQHIDACLTILPRVREVFSEKEYTMIVHKINRWKADHLDL